MTVALRYRLFMIASALLYMGPLVAGLAGFGWQMIVEFTVIFMLWLVVMRPAMWPADGAGWNSGRVIGKFLLWVAIQALVVSFCFAIGRGIGGTMGAVPPLPVWVPPLMSLLAVPLSRICWNPAASHPDMAGFADRAALEQPALMAAANAGPAEVLRLDEADRARLEAETQPWVKRLAALPEATREQDIMMLIGAALQDVPPLVLLNALSKAIDGPGQSPSLRRAFVMAVTDADIAATLMGQGMLSRAFDLAGEDAPRLQLFAARCATLLRHSQMAVMDTPQVARMADAARRHPAAARDILALIDQMGQLRDA